MTFLILVSLPVCWLVRKALWLKLAQGYEDCLPADGMELGGEARIAALARSVLTTEKQLSSDTGLSMSAGPLCHTIPVFFMLFILVGLVLRFAAVVDDYGFMPSSELSSSLLCDCSGGGPL